MEGRVKWKKGGREGDTCVFAPDGRRPASFQVLAGSLTSHAERAGGFQPKLRPSGPGDASGRYRACDGIARLRQRSTQFRKLAEQRFREVSTCLSGDSGACSPRRKNLLQGPVAWRPLRLLCRIHISDVVQAAQGIGICLLLQTGLKAPARQPRRDGRSRSATTDVGPSTMPAADYDPDDLKEVAQGLLIW